MSKSGEVKGKSCTDVLQEDLENTTGLFVDETRNTFHTASTGETTDGWLRDALDVVAKDLAMTLSSALSETLVDGQHQEQSPRTPNSALPFHPFHGQTLCIKCFERRRATEMTECVRGERLDMRRSSEPEARQALYSRRTTT